jgi:hypothetical protein
MGTVRHTSIALPAKNNKPRSYKTGENFLLAEECRAVPSLLSPWSIVLFVFVMMSGRLFLQALVAITPLTGVCAQYHATVPKLPSLLDATAEELTAGLESGSFTSVDLVQVCIVFASWY